MDPFVSGAQSHTKQLKSKMLNFNHFSVGLVDNVAGVLPLPNNLDQAEDDAHIPLHENGPEGKIMLEDDDQDPNGQV